MLLCLDEKDIYAANHWQQFYTCSAGLQNNRPEQHLTHHSRDTQMHCYQNCPDNNHSVARKGLGLVNQWATRLVQLELDLELKLAKHLDTLQFARINMPH